MLVPFFAVAQKVVTHTVGPKESLSSIGRMYNINGRELANYNKIDYNKGLTIGQVLKIPVKGDATPVATPPVVKETAKEKKPAKEATAKQTPPAKTTVAAKGNNAPVYHTVAKKETLYHISTLYNNVTVEDIKKWNHLTSDALSEGSKLIVGYTNGKNATAEEEKKDIPVVTQPAEKIKPAEDKIVKKETPPPPVKTVEPVTPPVSNMKAADFKGGIFKNIFDEQARGKSIVTETGTGGIFKSTSGWEDGKYYCLHNNAPAGTILKITNNATGKSVYAKVLDLITDIKQNSGLIIRISNAAADALGVTDNKLDCTINYSK